MNETTSTALVSATCNALDTETIMYILGSSKVAEPPPLFVWIPIPSCAGRTRETCAGQLLQKSNYICFKSPTADLLNKP